LREAAAAKKRGKQAAQEKQRKCFIFVSPISLSARRPRTAKGHLSKEQKSEVGTMVLFLGLILGNVFVVFLSSSCREMAKNAIKKTWKKFVFSTFLAKGF
jgi:hypothetical protein